MMKTGWGKFWWTLGGIILLVVLVGMLSRTRLKNSVENYKDELRAKGEKLETNEIIPRHTDTNNSLPIVRKIVEILTNRTDDVLNTNSPFAMRMVAPGKAMIGWKEPEIWSADSYNSWEEIADALKKVENILEPLEKLPENSHLDFDLDYKKGFLLLLHHLSPLKRTAQFQSAACLYHLHEGNTVSSVIDIHSGLKLLKIWNEEPLLISQLVRIAMAQILYNAQWELLQSTNVTEQQLTMLQHDWENLNFVTSMEAALLGERSCSISTIEQLRASTNILNLWGTFGGVGPASTPSSDWLDALKEFGQNTKTKAFQTAWKISWSYSDELNSLQADQILVETIREIRTNGTFFISLINCNRRLQTLHSESLHNNWLRVKLDDEMLGLFLGTGESLSRSLNRVLITEAARNLAITAIALKRYELIHHKYPSEPNALVPDFIPAILLDPVDGRPLRYHLNPDETFVLYSIGEDGIDDGGDASLTNSASKTFNWQKGRDWVWPQPASEAEIEKYRDNLPNYGN